MRSPNREEAKQAASVPADPLAVCDEYDVQLEQAKGRETNGCRTGSSIEGNLRNAGW